MGTGHCPNCRLVSAASHRLKWWGKQEAFLGVEWRVMVASRVEGREASSRWNQSQGQAKSFPSSSLLSFTKGKTEIEEEEFSKQGYLLNWIQVRRQLRGLGVRCKLAGQ